jgi:repressor LexA
MSKEQLTEKEMQALRHLRNAIVHEGHSPSIRELAQALGYKSPRTAFLVLNALIERGWLKRRADGELQFKRELPGATDHARTVQIPLVGSVACGVPLLAEENTEAYIPVSTSLAKPGHKYFFLRAVGDSMNAAGIQDGDLMLVRQQPQAENGQKVVALINDEATVKEFHRQGDAVVLKPRSRNAKHKPIVVTDDFIIQGVVTSVLPAKLC